MKMYGWGFCTDPISYALETMSYVRELIGQDMRIDICEKALQEYQSSQQRSETLAAKLALLTPEQLSALEVLLTPLTRG